MFLTCSSRRNRVCQDNHWVEKAADTQQSDEVIDEKGEMDCLKVKSLCGDHHVYRAARCDCDSIQVQV